MIFFICKICKICNFVQFSKTTITSTPKVATNTSPAKLNENNNISSNNNNKTETTTTTTTPKAQSVDKHVERFTFGLSSH